MKTAKVYPIQDHNNYLHFYQDQHSYLTSLLQTSNHQTSFKSLDHVSNSYSVNKFTKFLWAIDISPSCIKQYASNFAPILPLWIKFCFGKKLLSDVTGDLELGSNSV